MLTIEQYKRIIHDVEIIPMDAIQQLADNVFELNEFAKNPLFPIYRAAFYQVKTAFCQWLACAAEYTGDIKVEIESIQNNGYTDYAALIITILDKQYKVHTEAKGAFDCTGEQYPIISYHHDRKYRSVKNEYLIEIWAKVRAMIDRYDFFIYHYLDVVDFWRTVAMKYSEDVKVVCCHNKFSAIIRMNYGEPCVLGNASAGELKKFRQFMAKYRYKSAFKPGIDRNATCWSHPYHQVELFTNEAGDNVVANSTQPLSEYQKRGLIEFTIFYKGNIIIRYKETLRTLEIHEMELVEDGYMVPLEENWYQTRFNPCVEELSIRHK